MPITSSSVADFAPQHDGRVWVRERQTDSHGADHGVSYMAAAGTTPAQAATTANGRAASITAQMLATELAANVASAMALGSAAVIVNSESTQAQSDLTIRQAYATATGINAIQLGDYLRTIGASRLTAAFSLGSVVALQTTLNTLGTTATTVRTATGT